MLDLGVVLKSIPPMLWVVLAIVGALKVFLLWWNSPKQKGARGEKLVAQRLRAGLPVEYLILNDVYLPLADGTTTQIDHIVVSQYGIFVVETKTYSGWVFGDEKSPQWTQSIYRKKSRFQNPLRQNYLHICALSESLGLDKSFFHSVVAFTGDCTFKTEMPANVVFSRQAADFIRSFTTPIIKVSQVAEVAEVISEWQGTVGKEQRAAHVDNLRQRHAAVREDDAPRCPNCGGEMVLRTRKSDGSRFFGCRAYPKCRGMRPCSPA